ncbi:MAG: hypothetical protein ACRDLO_14785, partial [Solirubrobacterales bacterium]
MTTSAVRQPDGRASNAPPAWSRGLPSRRRKPNLDKGCPQPHGLLRAVVAQAPTVLRRGLV